MTSVALGPVVRVAEGVMPRPEVFVEEGVMPGPVVRVADGTSGVALGLVDVRVAVALGPVVAVALGVFVGRAVLAGVEVGGVPVRVAVGPPHGAALHAYLVPATGCATL